MLTSLIALAILPAADVTGVVTDGGRPVKDAVVWLSGGATPKPVKASIEQKGKKFIPRILVVPMGSAVDFPNRDDLFHNVFAEYQAKKFDLGQFPRGKSKTVEFDKPGVVSVLCNVHSEMSAFIVVVDTDHYGKTDSRGQFKIDAPEGDFTLKAWHESGKTSNQSINVSRGMAPLKVAIKRG